MKIIFAFVTIASLLFSCDNFKQTQEITIKNKYSMELPKGMIKSNRLNASASLQYENGTEELYIIVLDE